MSRIIRNFARIGIMGVLLLALMATASLTATTSLAAPAHGHADSDTNAQAMLRHAPHGAATLFWSPDSHALTVTIALVGLAANTSHPAHIHMGTCATNGPIIIPLSDVQSNAGGDAVSTTTIPNVMGGIPATGWFVNVHSGPTLTGTQATPISCGNVVNHHASTRHFQFVFVTMGSTTAANQNASGSASITLHHGTLTVNVTVRGLVPGSMHAAHIHAGSCEVQQPGNVLFPLNTLVANGNGVATSMTVFKNVAMSSIPEHGWYVNVHFSTDLSNQVGFDPIACGDVVA